MRIDLSCPVENLKTIVKTNSETGEQYLLLKLLNISEKTIVSVSFNVEVYNSSGVLITTLPIEFDELTAEPKSFFAENKAIPLTDVSEGKNFVIKFTKAVFEDSEIYEPSDENTVVVSSDDASVDEVIAMRKFIPEAICFSQETDTHWKCVCGRPNFIDSESCVRCGNKKTEMLSKFSSSENLENTIEQAKAEEESKAIEAARLAEEERAAKKAKIKKYIIAAGITVASLAILIGLFFAGRIVYFNISGDNALKSGDYEKAYYYYSKTGNDKINKTIDHVRGNTNANLLAGGISAEDEDNLYYLTYDAENYCQNLIKQNKNTKKTQILTDSATGGLSVTKDFIYYLDSDNQVSKITKDGKKIEKVLEKEVIYINVIGKDLYFIQMDYDNPNNLSLEQCKLLAQQGQIKSFYRLYRYDLKTKEDSLVSEEGMLTCHITNDRIYYISDSEDVTKANHLMSMSLNGKDIKTVVESPVSGVQVKDDFIYYCDIESNYKIIKLNLKDNSKEEILYDYIPLIFNSHDSKLLVTCINREEYTNYISGASEAYPDTVLLSYDMTTGDTKTLVTGDIYTFNVTGDDIFCVINPSGVCRLRTDGTGFDIVYADGTSTPPEAPETEETAE